MPTTEFEKRRPPCVSKSAIETYNNCRYKYAYRYIWGIDTPQTVAQLTGIEFHHAVQYVSDRMVENKYNPNFIDQTFIDNVGSYIADRYHKIFTDNKYGHIPPNQLTVSNCQVVSMVTVLIISSRWFFEDFNFVETELKIKNPETKRSGIVDGILEDKTTKQLWLVSYKTRSRLDNITTLGLDMDLEANYYVDMFSPYVETKYKKPIEGFYYIAMQKPAHRLNDKGPTDLISRMYAAMMADIDKYLICERIPLTTGIIKKNKESIQRQISEVSNVTPDKIYKNMSACFQYGACPYLSLCQTGENPEYPIDLTEHPFRTQFIVKDKDGRI